MPRIKTESLKEGAVVSADVKNIDNMLLVPAGTKLTARHITIFQMWGITEVDVQAATGTGDDGDPLKQLPPDVLVKLAADLEALFWQPDKTSPVFKTIFNLLLLRRARQFRGGTPTTS